MHASGVQHVDVQEVIAAPIDTVWARYTDHVSWTEWAGLGRVQLARQGVPPPNGVGAVRRISSFGVGVEEEVLTWDPPRRMTYRIVRDGLPLRDHLGEVLFTPEAGGTRVTWRCQFNSAVPGMGRVFRAVITQIFRRALRSLARDLS